MNTQEEHKKVKKNVKTSKQYQILYFEDALTTATQIVKDIMKQYQEEGYPMLAYSSELYDCRFFSNQIDYSKKLLQYKKKADYYQNNELERKTAGFSGSISFRCLLCQFIKDLKACPITKESNIYAKSLPTGEFIPVHRIKFNETYSLNAEEKILFNLYCFAKVNEFWDQALELLTINPAKKAIVLCNIFSLLDNNKYTTTDILRNLLSLDHEIIIVENCN